MPAPQTPRDSPASDVGLDTLDPVSSVGGAVDLATAAEAHEPAAVDETVVLGRDVVDHESVVARGPQDARAARPDGVPEEPRGVSLDERERGLTVIDGRGLSSGHPWISSLHAPSNASDVKSLRTSPMADDECYVGVRSLLVLGVGRVGRVEPVPIEMELRLIDSQHISSEFEHDPAGKPPGDPCAEDLLTRASGTPDAGSQPPPPTHPAAGPSLLLTRNARDEPGRGLGALSAPTAGGANAPTFALPLVTRWSAWRWKVGRAEDTPEYRHRCVGVKVTFERYPDGWELVVALGYWFDGVSVSVVREPDSGPACGCCGGTLQPVDLDFCARCEA